MIYLQVGNISHERIGRIFHCPQRERKRARERQREAGGWAGREGTAKMWIKSRCKGLLYTHTLSRHLLFSAWEESKKKKAQRSPISNVALPQAIYNLFIRRHKYLY